MKPVQPSQQAAGRIRPKKALGQNFLQTPAIAAAIASLATSPVGGSVLEIGPGLGALTTHLLLRVDRLIALERDEDLLPGLQQNLAEKNGDASSHASVEIKHADALEVDWLAELTRGPAPYRLVGNLPYSITGPLLRKATACAGAIDKAVFMVQREVADRLAAAAGEKAYGALSVFVQAAFRVERELVVKPGSFWPVPGVDSAVVVLTPHRPPRAVETDAFREVVKRAFAQRRKKLRNAWSGMFGWSADELAHHAKAAGISLDARGETLTVEAFAALATRPQNTP